MNKGQLVNDQIIMTSAQGSTSSYDAAGNVLDAAKYDHGVIQNYHYVYNEDNQLELIQSNGIKLQSKFYDGAGRVREEHSFDNLGNLSQENIISFSKGLLEAQMTKRGGIEISHTIYKHDKVGNLTELKLHVNGQGRTPGYTLRHEYDYALWDSYQQNLDTATQTSDQGGSTIGTSRRVYDENRQLSDAIDSHGINTNHYLNSTIEGIKAREDKDGQTSYLSVAGKTIGDLRLDKQGKQHLTVYGGFTPSGSQEKSDPLTQLMWKRNPGMPTSNNFLGRVPTASVEGTLPEAPQDNLGAYTLQAGDTLESIALQIYGDSSLWYLLADANGISDRNAQVGSSDQLHIGQRLNIPPVATGQHHSNRTHKVLNANQMIGNTSATTANPLPPAPPPLPKKHHGFFSKIVVAIVAVVATVMTAGIVGALAGATIQGAGGLFALGMGVLGGTATTTAGVTLAAGFAAGFISSIASQGVAKRVAWLLATRIYLPLLQIILR